jgi:hypothetical protein
LNDSAIELNNPIFKIQKRKLAVCDHVEKRQKKNSEAESFRHMKIKLSYMPEDGHVG